MLLNDLKALGYEDDRSASIDIVGGEGDPERLKKVVAEIIANRPSVIAAITTPAASALKNAGVDRPVVFGFVSDPVGVGLVQSLAHPDGKFTGITFGDAKLGSKRFACRRTSRVAARCRAVGEFVAGECRHAGQYSSCGCSVKHRGRRLSTSRCGRPCPEFRGSAGRRRTGGGLHDRQ